MSDFEPFYNVDLSYEDNYARGPFGEFAAALRGDVPAGEAASPAKSSFLGIPVDLPFGIPAGPLLNERLLLTGGPFCLASVLIESGWADLPA